MVRRIRSSVFEDLIEIIAKLPWWIGLLLALIFYIWLHHVASQPIVLTSTEPNRIGNYLGQQLWHSSASILQFILPITCLIGAAVSAFHKYFKKTANGNAAHKSWNPSNPSTSRKPDELHSANHEVTPGCPVCGAQMVLRTSKKGINAGKQFWGCHNFPTCRGTRS